MFAANNRLHKIVIAYNVTGGICQIRNQLPGSESYHARAPTPYYGTVDANLN